MFGIKRVIIAENERALVLRNRSVEKILEPGIYWLWGNTQVQVYDLSQAEFAYPKIDSLLEQHPKLIQQYFERVNISDFQLGLVYKNERLADVLPPGDQALYWKGPIKVRVEVLDIKDEYEIPRQIAALISKSSNVGLQQINRNHVLTCEVPDEYIGLLIEDGKLMKTLQPGAYAFWKFNRSLKIEQADLRIQSMEVTGQEILSKDKVSLRINLAAQYRINDPVLARNKVKNVVEHLYRALQFALRQSVGTRTLDALLGNKGELDRTIFEVVSVGNTDFGLEITHVGVKDIILPGDMKDILNQVVAAEKSAQANVIKRREETAAARSLLNTAKLMDDNPTLMRLKELEALEKITEKVDRLTVFGGMEGILQDTVKINLRGE